MNRTIILKHLREIRPEIDFERMFPQRTEEAAEIISRLYSRLNACFNQPSSDALSDPQFYSGLIGWKAITTTMASLEMFRRGYSSESLLLLRNTLETAAVIIHMRLKPSLYERVAAGTHSSSKSIDPATKVIPIMRGMYGALSDFAHVKPVSAFPGNMRSPAGNHTLLIGGGFDESKKAFYAVLLNDIELLLFILESSLEYALYPFLPEMRHWKESNGTLERIVPPEAKQRVAEMSKMERYPNAQGL